MEPAAFVEGGIQEADEQRKANDVERLGNVLKRKANDVDTCLTATSNLASGESGYLKNDERAFDSSVTADILPLLKRRAVPFEQALQHTHEKDIFISAKTPECAVVRVANGCHPVTSCRSAALDFEAGTIRPTVDFEVCEELTVPVATNGDSYSCQMQSLSGFRQPVGGPVSSQENVVETLGAPLTLDFQSQTVSPSFGVLCFNTRGVRGPNFLSCTNTPSSTGGTSYASAQHAYTAPETNLHQTQCSTAHTRIFYDKIGCYTLTSYTEDLKQFRQWGSKTPDHPDNFETHGVEVTTGPLGQGIANAVSVAVGDKHLAARYNKPDAENVDQYCILEDGCQMEGIANEACSLAGHWGLGKLISFCDDNHISIDVDTEIAFTESVDTSFG